MVTTHTIPVQETQYGDKTGGPSQHVVMYVHRDMIGLRLLLPDMDEWECPQIFIERKNGKWDVLVADADGDEAASVVVFDGGSVAVIEK